MRLFIIELKDGEECVCEHKIRAHGDGRNYPYRVVVFRWSEYSDDLRRAGHERNVHPGDDDERGIGDARYVSNIARFDLLIKPWFYRLEHGGVEQRHDERHGVGERIYPRLACACHPLYHDAVGRVQYRAGEIMRNERQIEQHRVLPDLPRTELPAAQHLREKEPRIDGELDDGEPEYAGRDLIFSMNDEKNAERRLRDG